MQETLANLNADFLFPKLHGMWARSLSGEDLRRLIQSHRLEALERALGPRGLDVNQRAAFQKQLTCRFIAELSSVRRLLDPKSADFYSGVIDRYFFENLKTVLHYHFFPEREVSIQFLLIDAPELPPIDGDRVLEARNINQLFREIPQHPVRDDLLPMLVELEDTRDILDTECRLDQMYYAGFLEAARKLPLATRRAGVRLVQTEIDVTNIVMILRNIELYDLDAETVADLCIEGGALIDRSLLADLTQLETTDEVVSALPKAYRRLLEPLMQAELYMSENALWNEIFHVAHECFRDYDRPALSIVAFPFLKRAEMLNIGRIFEGMHFGLSAADVEEMMIGAAYV